MSKRKHITLTIKQKAEILDKLKNGVSGRSLALQYGIGTSTISDLRKNEYKIRSFIGTYQSGHGYRKTTRQAEYPEMETELYSWFTEQRSKNIPISCEILGTKARRLFQDIYGVDTFVASRGWLLNFKKRHGLMRPKICEDKLSNEESTVAHPFIAKLRKIIEAHDLLPRQIYNANWSGLFWKLLPDETLVHNNEATPSGIKSSKERITFLTCTNGDGTRKLPLLIIGKTQNPNPREFGNKTLPVEYVSSDAFLTSEIFINWFQNSFCTQVKSFLKKKRLPEKALLLIDKAPSHCSERELISEDGNIFTLFVPPNCTALRKPVDQDDIRLTKLNYRKSLLAHILSLLQDEEDVARCLKSINLNDAVCLLHNSWQKVTTNYLEKCWHKLLSGILPDSDLDDLIPPNLLQHQLQQIGNDYQDISNMLTQIDGKIHMDFEINQWVGNADNIREDGDLEHEATDDTNNEEINIQPKKIKHEDAVKCFSLALQWAEQNNVGIGDMLVLKDLQEKAIVKHSSLIAIEKQSKT